MKFDLRIIILLFLIIGVLYIYLPKNVNDEGLCTKLDISYSRGGLSLTTPTISSNGYDLITIKAINKTEDETLQISLDIVASAPATKIQLMEVGIDKINQINLKTSNKLVGPKGTISWQIKVYANQEPPGEYKIKIYPNGLDCNSKEIIIKISED